MNLRNEWNGFRAMVTDGLRSSVSIASCAWEAIVNLAASVPAAFRKDFAEALIFTAVSWAANAAFLIYSLPQLGYKTPDPYDWMVLGTALLFSLVTVGMMAKDKEPEEPTTAREFVAHLILPYLLIFTVLLWLLSKLLVVGMVVGTSMFVLYWMFFN